MINCEATDRVSMDLDDLGAKLEELRPRLMAFFVSRTRNLAVAEDLTSEIIIKAFRNIDKYQVQDGASFTSWIFKIARNFFIDSARRAQTSGRANQLSSDQITNEPVGGDPLDIVVMREEVQNLISIVDGLSKRHQRVIFLRSIEKLRYREIAGRLGLSEDATKKLHNRALANTRRQFKNRMESELELASNK